MAYGIKQTIPPAWHRIKNQIVDVINYAELKQKEFRDNPTQTNWEDYCSAVVTIYLKIRNKIYIVEKKTNPKHDYDKLRELRKYYINLDGLTPESDGQDFCEYLELLQDLAEETGLTKVSVEDENIDDLWKENL